MTVKFPLSDGSGRRLVGGVSVDLTEWRQAQTALARSERRYEQLVEQASDAIVLARRRPAGLIAVNSAACTLTGYSREELLAMRVDDLLDPGDLAGRPRRASTNCASAASSSASAPGAARTARQSTSK